jgi:diguanylate cyclase (GGDEF)-like protein/PAS domain S-box-containing protein
MEPLNKESRPQPRDHCEDLAHDSRKALELCASLGDYQTSLTKFKNRKDIFERSVQGLKQILPITFYAFYAVDETTFDIEIEHCDQPEQKAYLNETLDVLIEQGLVAQAFREKRTLSALTKDGQHALLLHALTTTSKTYGLFICFLNNRVLEDGIAGTITTIIIKSTCYALENFELYQLIDLKNEELTAKNQQISKSEIIYRNVFENTGNPTIIVDASGKITYSNSRFVTFSKWTRDELWTKHFADFLIKKRLSFAELLEETQSQDPVKPIEYIFENKLLEKRTVFLQISPHGIDNQYIISLTDITALKEVEQKLHFQAFHDPLTSLPNRMLLQDRLKQAIRKRNRHPDSKYAVIFIDLDRFKSINDTLGHHIGDQLLIRVGERIKNCVREMDTVARFGGDEFVILLEDVQSEHDCERVSGRILEEFQSAMNIQGHEIFMSISMGILMSGTQPIDASDVIRLADMSMYEAKKQGRNKIVYFHDIADKEIEQKLFLENQLLKGLQNNEFFVQYQPLMDLQSNRLFGFEALVRWNHPDLGIIPPNSFIPIAEETGLIIPLGQKIFELAFQDYVRWIEAYPWVQDLCLSINLSVKQIYHKDIVQDIKSVAERHHLPMKNVRLEITESIFLENNEQAIETIRRLKELGVSICIDDFGTGYSSLKYLQQFAIDLVKIDKLLVQDIHTNEINYSIVSSMLDLCNKLKLQVMAEGIETNEQLMKLRTMNCALGQGYYFAKPQDGQTVENTLLKGREENKGNSGG